MKNFLQLIFCIVALTTTLQAQNPLVKQWDKRFGGTSTDLLYSLKQTTDGGVGGYKTQASQGLQDYWIVKFCDSTNFAFVPVCIFSSTDSLFCEKQCIDFSDLS
jgi:hypothetical protein